jgi:ribosomal protein S19E (S16A)
MDEFDDIELANYIDIGRGHEMAPRKTDLVYLRQIITLKRIFL